MNKTYELVAIWHCGVFVMTGIKCLVCQRTSYNTNDVHNLYCGNCHIFHNKEQR